MERFIKSLLRPALVLGFAVAIYAAAGDSMSLPFTDDFESSGGYTTSTWPTASPWTKTGAIGITDIDWSSGIQSAFLDPGSVTPKLALSLSTSSAPIVFVRAAIRPVSGPLSELPALASVRTGASTAIALITKDTLQGELYVLNGNAPGGAAWVQTGLIFPVTSRQADDWIEVTCRVDYAAKTWDLFVDGTMEMADIGFADPTSISLHLFELYGSPLVSSGLDHFTASATNPLFSDADKDGLSDSYETAHGMDPNSDDRHSDLDGDGINNLAEFLAGTDPSFPSFLNGSASFPFNENFESFSAGTLSSSTGWKTLGLGSVQIEAGQAYEGSKSLLLQGNGGAPISLERIIDGRTQSVVWVDLNLKPTFQDGPAASLEPGASAAFYFDHDGYLQAFNGTSDQWVTLPGSPRPLNLVPIQSGSWARVTVRLDYTAQTWSVWLNGVRAAQNLGFADANAYFKFFNVSGAYASRLDDIHVTSTTPSGLVDPVEDSAAPTTPASVQAQAMSDTTLRVSWVASTDNVAVVGYRVYRDGTLKGETAGLEFQDTTATPGVSYQYTVKAYDGWDNQSALSTSVQGATPVLLHSGTGLSGSYFNKIQFENPVDPVLTRLDSQIDFAWPGNSSPAVGVKSKRFSARWTGLIEAEKTGSYIFEVTANDGARLWIDGKQLVNGRRYGGSQIFTASIDLQVGRLVPVVLDYYEYDYDAAIRLKWKAPGSTVTVAVPTTQLYPSTPIADVVASSAPQGLHVAEQGDNRLLLSWDQPADDLAVASYRIFRNGVLIGSPLIPVWEDLDLSPATSGNYYVQAVDFAGNVSVAGTTVSVATSAALLPEPWRHRDVGYPVTKGTVAYNSGNGQFTVKGAGRSVYDDEAGGNPDELNMVYRRMSGDFMVTTKINSFTAPAPEEGAHQLTHAGARAGLMVRGGFEGHDPYFAATLGSDGSAQLYARDLADGKTWKPSPSSYPAPSWIRVARIGNNLLGAYSVDGTHWETIASRTVPMDEECFVGFMVASNNPVELATAVFSNVSATAEVQLDSLIDERDTDGDGISDWEEMVYYHTDPNVVDINLSGTPIARTGSQGVGFFGSWKKVGDAFVSETVKASADFSVNVTDAGIYRLQVEVAPGLNQSTSQLYPVSLYVDGQLVERFEVYMDGTSSVFLKAATPWLAAGSHVVRVFYDNTYSYRQLKINGVQLQGLGGDDADSDGVPTWAENLLDTNNQLKLSTGAESLISPACVEGRSRYRGFLKFSADEDEIPVSPEPGFGWYVNVPLDAANAVAVEASFENGAKVQSQSITWKVLNLETDAGTYATSPLRIRKDDSLLLAVHPAAATSGTSVLTVDGPGAVETVEYEAGNALQAQPHLFTQPGLYTLTGHFDDGDSNTTETDFQIQVEVVQAEFAGDATARATPALQWDNPLIPATVSIETDQGVTLQAVAPLSGGGTRFKISTINYVDSYVLARLGEDGPVTDHAAVHSIRVASNDETAVDLLERYPDGSRLMGTPLILNRVTPDTRVEISIVVPGVTFEDGTTFKVLTAADFDQYGRAYLKFVWATDAPFSICHVIRVFEGDKDLGDF